MKRRDVLVITAPVVVLPAGCLRTQNSKRNSESSESTQYESTKLIEIVRQEKSPLVDGLSPHSETKYHVAVVDSPSNSAVNREYLRQNDGQDLLAFLDKTSFETERILALQARHMSTARYLDPPSLEIDVDERIEGTISIGSAEGGGGAVTRETLFVRIEVDAQNPTGARITIHENEDSVTVTTD